MKKVPAALFAFAFPLLSSAASVAAADVSFRCLGGLQYEFTVTAWTVGQPQFTDSVCYLNYGDGSPVGWLSPVSMVQQADTAYYSLTWTSVHNYTGSGTFSAEAVLVNHRPGIQNIPNSMNTRLALPVMLTISPLTGCNSSPVSADPGLVKTVFLSQNHTWNGMTTDPDGDSLVHSFVACNDTLGNPISGYIFPDVPANLNIDPVTGQYFWNNPQSPGLFNVTIKTEEWYRFPNGNSVLVGSVTREIEFNVVQATGITEAAIPRFNIYPNPAVSGGEITITPFSVIGDKTHTRIVNMYGQTLWESGAARNATTTLPELAEGVYLWQIGSNGNWLYSDLLVIRNP